MKVLNRILLLACTVTLMQSQVMAGNQSDERFKESPVNVAPGNPAFKWKPVAQPNQKYEYEITSSLDERYSDGYYTYEVTSFYIVFSVPATYALIAEYDLWTDYNCYSCPQPPFVTKYPRIPANEYSWQLGTYVTLEEEDDVWTVQRGISFCCTYAAD